MIQPQFNIHDRQHGRKLVRRAILMEGDLADAMMHLAMGPKREWTPGEIIALNDELEHCDLSISQWLERKGEG